MQTYRLSSRGTGLIAATVYSVIGLAGGSGTYRILSSGVTGTPSVVPVLDTV
jgi:hypothetical protein